MSLADILDELDTAIRAAGDDANYFDEDRQTENARWLQGRVLRIDEGDGRRILRTPPLELREALKRAETTGFLPMKVYFRARAEFYDMSRPQDDSRWFWSPK